MLLEATSALDNSRSQCSHEKWRQSKGVIHTRRTNLLSPENGPNSDTRAIFSVVQSHENTRVLYPEEPLHFKHTLPPFKTVLIAQWGYEAQVWAMFFSKI